MNDPFSEIRNALYEAKQAQRAADINANRMAEMLRGRLKHVSRTTLQELKHELKGFNAKTCVWKD